MGLFSPVIRQYLEQVSDLAKGRLLDVGCGNKPYKDVFRNVSEYIGVDLAPENGVENRPESRLSSIDIYASATDLPFPDASFNVVLCTQVIAHLMQPGRFFSEASRVLIPGGILIVTFPLINPLFEVPHEYFRYTEFSFAEFCKGNNLVVQKIEKMGGGWLSVAFLARCFLYQDSQKVRNRLAGKVLYFVGSIIYGLLERLDRKDKHPECPLNYLGVARKTQEPQSM